MELSRVPGHFEECDMTSGLKALKGTAGRQKNA